MNRFMAGCRPILNGVLLAAVLWTTPATAQLTVFDPSNYAQNVLQAARALEQIANQVASLQNEALMLENQARNLARLDTSSVAQFNASVARVTALMSRAEGILYDVAQAQAEYDRLYPAAYSAAGAAGQLVADAEQRWDYSLSGFRHAMQVQAEIVDGLADDQEAAGGLVGQSQNAVGMLQATQAGNQLLALQVEQMGRLQALLAAQGRAQALEQARNVAAQAQAREQFRRFLIPAGADAPVSVSMFHD